MGWNSANEIFDPVADKLIELGVSDEVKTEVLSVLIAQLQDRDWDTEEESLGEYVDDPAIVEAFRRNDIVVTCADESPEGEWCELEKDHLSDHESYKNVRWENIR